MQHAHTAFLFLKTFSIEKKNNKQHRIKMKRIFVRTQDGIHITRDG